MHYYNCFFSCHGVCIQQNKTVFIVIMLFWNDLRLHYSPCHHPPTHVTLRSNIPTERRWLLWDFSRKEKRLRQVEILTEKMKSPLLKRAFAMGSTDCWIWKYSYRQNERNYADKNVGWFGIFQDYVWNWNGNRKRVLIEVLFLCKRTKSGHIRHLSGKMKECS